MAHSTSSDGVHMSWQLRRFDSYGGHDVRFASVQSKDRSEMVPIPKERLMW